MASDWLYFMQYSGLAMLMENISAEFLFCHRKGHHIDSSLLLFG